MSLTPEDPRAASLITPVSFCLSVKKPHCPTVATATAAVTMLVIRGRCHRARRFPGAADVTVICGSDDSAFGCESYFTKDLSVRT